MLIAAAAAWELGALGGVILAAALGGLAGLLIHTAVAWGVQRIALRAGSAVGTALELHARPPARLLFALAGAQLVLLGLAEPARVLEVLRHAVALGLIVSGAWLVVRLTLVVDRGVGAYFEQTGHAADLSARRLQTRIRVVRRVVVAVVWVVAVASMLMTFPRAWQLGASLLASAGIVGLAAGLAARPVLGNLIAGVQIAVTQPIKLEDAVVIDGQFGWVEEITATYVVLRSREGRRTIVPVVAFVEKSYENWTRTTSQVVGSATVIVDRSTDVSRLRDELRRILERSGLWDGQIWSLEVSNVMPAGLEVRATMSAASPGAAWELQSFVREELMRFVRSEVKT